MSSFMYILKCSDGSYYTGSTRNIEQRFNQHQSGKGAKYTATRLPVELVYLEEYTRIDEAFYREKQVQGWSRKKKEALMRSDWESLHELAKCQNASTSLSNLTSKGEYASASLSSQDSGSALSRKEGSDLSEVACPERSRRRRTLP